MGFNSMSDARGLEAGSWQYRWSTGPVEHAISFGSPLIRQGTSGSSCSGISWASLVAPEAPSAWSVRLAFDGPRFFLRRLSDACRKSWDFWDSRRLPEDDD